MRPISFHRPGIQPNSEVSEICHITSFDTRSSPFVLQAFSRPDLLWLLVCFISRAVFVFSQSAEQSQPAVLFSCVSDYEHNFLPCLTGDRCLSVLPEPYPLTYVRMCCRRAWHGWYNCVLNKILCWLWDARSFTTYY